MGEIADGILNGDFDEETGEYIGEGMGFPRSPSREAREKYESYSTGKRGMDIFLKKQDIIMNNRSSIVREYYTTILSRSKNHSYTKMCGVISDDFYSFINWFNNTWKKKNLQKDGN